MALCLDKSSEACQAQFPGICLLHWLYLAVHVVPRGMWLYPAVHVVPRGMWTTDSQDKHSESTVISLQPGCVCGLFLTVLDSERRIKAVCRICLSSMTCHRDCICNSQTWYVRAQYMYIPWQAVGSEHQLEAGLSFVDSYAGLLLIRFLFQRLCDVRTRVSCFGGWNRCTTCLSV